MRYTTKLVLTALPLFLPSAALTQGLTSAAGTSNLEGAELKTISLDSSDNLHILIRKGFRIRGVNQAVAGEITQPVFHGEQLVIAAGTRIRGHITSLEKAERSVYVTRLMNGDLTPPHSAIVSFDELLLPDGRKVPLQTGGANPINGLTMSLWQTKGEKVSLKQQVRTQFHQVIAAPYKMQRLAEALVTSLPYHPDYVDQGTAFNVAVTNPVQVTLNDQLCTPEQLTSMPGKPQYLHLRLLTALNTHDSVRDQSLRAVVSEPFYNADHTLVLNAGTEIAGQLRQVKSAAWMHKQGGLHFEFAASDLSQAAEGRSHLRVVGVEAATGEFLAVDKEGSLKATSSRLQQITAPLSFIGPSRALNDTSKIKTAYQRSGEGRKGFGLLGSGAAQASASTAIGLGYFGAAKHIYNSFIAKGSDVDLPVNTALLLKLE